MKFFGALALAAVGVAGLVIIHNHDAASTSPSDNLQSEMAAWWSDHQADYNAWTDATSAVSLDSGSQGQATLMQDCKTMRDRAIVVAHGTPPPDSILAQHYIAAANAGVNEAQSCLDGDFATATKYANTVNSEEHLALTRINELLNSH